MSMRAIYDTRGTANCQNICVWFDGTVKPMKGHNGNCKWAYDGQIYYHKKASNND